MIDVGDNGELEGHLGRTLNDIAEETGQSVVAVLADLALRSDLALQLKSPPIGATGPEQARSYLDHAGVIGGGSDGGAHTMAFGMGHHPTDLLIWLVREQGARTLEDMHFQLSLKTARAVQIQDRGALTHEGGVSNGQTPGQVVRVTSPSPLAGAAT